jgi:hypothetical protein
MGKTVKMLVALAVMIAAPWAAPWLATTLGVSALTAGMIYGAFAMLVSGALMASAMPDMAGVDSVAGQKLQTNKSNTTPGPIIDGEHRLGGNIIFQKTNSAKNADSSSRGYNRDYWAIMVISGHDIEEVTKISANEDALTYSAWSYTDNWHQEYVHIRYYSASSSVTDIRNVVWQSDDTAFGAKTGASMGFPSVDIPANCAFLAVHQAFDADESKNTSMANITAEIKGKKIRTLDSASTISTAETYSSNPAEILLDILGEALAVPDADIDIASFYDVKTECVANGWLCHIALIRQNNIQSIIQQILGSCRGTLIHSDNGWKMKVDTKGLTVDKAITDDDILNQSLAISMKGSAEIANRVIVKYIDPDDNWLPASVVAEDTALQTADGQVIEFILDAPACTNRTQAAQLAEITLNNIRYSEDSLSARVKRTPLNASFSTTVKNADLEVGDIISINHALLDRVRKFSIMSVKNDQSGAISIDCREYCDTFFKDSTGVYLI